MEVHKNIKMLELVASKLASLKEKTVFVGGAVASLYKTDAASARIRATSDVDCVIEVYCRADFTKIEEDLRSLGFRNCLEEDAPICRWLYNDVKIDIMPSKKEILGFANIWYKNIKENSQKYQLPSGNEIFILKLPYFIATKIEAYHGREEKDFRLSHDIEDIIMILDGLMSFDDILKAPDDVRTYLQKELKIFMKSDLFIEALSSSIDLGDSPLRTKRITDFLRVFLQN